MDIRTRIPVITTLATNAPAVTKNEIWPKRVFLSFKVLIWFNTRMVQLGNKKTHRYLKPRAATTLKAGMLYIMNRHSLWPRLLMRRMKTMWGNRRDKILGSLSKPMHAMGKPVMSNLGRCTVK